MAVLDRIWIHFRYRTSLLILRQKSSDADELIPYSTDQEGRKMIRSLVPDNADISQAERCREVALLKPGPAITPTTTITPKFPVVPPVSHQASMTPPGRLVIPRHSPPPAQTDSTSDSRLLLAVCCNPIALLATLESTVQVANHSLLRIYISST